MKPIYFFDEGSGRNKKLLGGKGAGLIEMTRLGLPVPPGFTITTEVCTVYYDNNKKLPRNLMPQVKKNIQKIERKTGKEFGSLQNPLLVSVRSGAAISMPGMMDTILNLGLNDQTVIGLADASKNPRFAWDSYRRFVQLFGKVVFGIDDKQFDEVLQNAKRQQNVQQDHELSEQSLREIVSEYKSICQQYTGKLFPEDPYSQLALAIEAVFKSWMGERAVVYREKYKITKEIANGTAVSVVTMVFGNMGNDSVTGVIFTRNPSDGTRQIFGDYLVNAQGEDVVAGIRTPQPIDAMIKELPATYQQLMKTCEKLEKYFKEPQDIEFTVEKGRFYLLQTRAAKMNAAGMIKTSVDMLKERLVSKERAILRLNPEDLDQLLHNTIDNEAGKKLLVDSRVVSEGEIITIDGSNGKVYVGEIPTVEPKLTDDFKTILGWAQKLKKLGIRANADTPQAAKLALIYGAEGIGLCRTERMFNARDRLPVFVEMVMAKTVAERKEALEKLRLLQKEDFKEILTVMDGYHVTSQLLDPPLHEFLPNLEELINKIHLLDSKGSSDELTASQRFLQRAKELAEVNPMMGHRGVRMGITYPEIYEMQIRAICEAAAELTSENINIHPQIMVPQVSSVSELDYIKKIYQNIKSDIEAGSGIKLKINFGTMLEVVRACLTSDELAKVAEFFSFGTNDLTQAVFSFSREDVEGKFLPEYIEKEIIKENPFESLDVKGVGSLMHIAISKGRSVKPNLEIGICGEHGGDPRSVKFCHKAGLTYVSASSHRVPIAILAAAQVALEKQMKIPKTRPGHKK